MTKKPFGPPPQLHPAVASELRRRRQDVQLRTADVITNFAGSMQFVYLHAVLFAAWMIWLEKSPWPTLTLFVSLEAIFLSTFVMIGQNRQSAFAQEKANHDFGVAEQELHENTKITRLIHELAIEIHRHDVDQHNAGQMLGRTRPRTDPRRPIPLSSAQPYPGLLARCPLPGPVTTGATVVPAAGTSVWCFAPEGERSPIAVMALRPLIGGAPPD